MSDRNERTIKSWVESSDYDIDTAKGMLQLGKRIFVGFMCHLAMEKMLKACYVKIDWQNTSIYSQAWRTGRRSGAV